MFFCRNRQFLQESSIFEMRVVNVFVNRFFSMKWGIFEKCGSFSVFFIPSGAINKIRGCISINIYVIQSEAKNLGNIHVDVLVYATRFFTPLRSVLNDKNVRL